MSDDSDSFQSETRSEDDFSEENDEGFEYRLYDPTDTATHPGMDDDESTGSDLGDLVGDEETEAVEDDALIGVWGDESKADDSELVGEETPQPRETPLGYFPSYKSDPIESTFFPFLDDGVPFYKFLYSAPKRVAEETGVVNILVTDDFGCDLPDDLKAKPNVVLLTTVDNFKSAGFAVTDEFESAWLLFLSKNDTLDIDTHGTDVVRLILEIMPRCQVFCVSVFRNGNHKLGEASVAPLVDAIVDLSLSTYADATGRIPRIVCPEGICPLLRMIGSPTAEVKIDCVSLAFGGSSIDEVLRDEIADLTAIGSVFFASPCCEAGRGVRCVFPAAFGIRGLAAVTAVRLRFTDPPTIGKFRSVSSRVTLGAFAGKSTLLPVPISEDRSVWRLLSGASFVAPQIIALAALAIEAYPCFRRDPMGLENFLVRVLGKNLLHQGANAFDPETGLSDTGTRFSIPSFLEEVEDLDEMVAAWFLKMTFVLLSEES